MIGAKKPQLRGLDANKLTRINRLVNLPVDEGGNDDNRSGNIIYISAPTVKSDRCIKNISLLRFEICPDNGRSARKLSTKNLAMLTTCIQSHEAECILRTNGIIKEDVSALAEGKRLVPVPIPDIGCEVGLHGGKWGRCVFNKLKAS